ncbi:MAG: aminoacyl-histidine dipeptidase [Candidatus Gastranaerophilales bacterium]|nr:aminoacyl-histidine dipeptidase [Candidatus Gastranaerophilales bacterium]
MMGVLSGLEPERVFYYFEEIAKIPHGSGNVDRLSDYLASFAERRNLFYIQDVLKNIIIIKEAAPGYEDRPPVILQGHMDMVAVHRPDLEIDMKTEALRLAVDGDRLYAEGTSLGGDDGIAVAYALALLESDTLRHPCLEVVITVDEETGMDGARGIDLSVLQGHRMVNLDSEKEGVFLTSCAGGARVNVLLPVGQGCRDGVICEVKLGGLAGGHSGDEIHKERGNSNCLFGRLLYALSGRVRVSLISVDGGVADNAIPRETTARLLISKEEYSVLEETVESMEAALVGELAVKDPDVALSAVRIGNGRSVCVTPEDTRRAAAFLCAAPNGVQAMNIDLEGLVETSLNLGRLRYDAAKEEMGEVAVVFSVRSSVESAKDALIARLQALTELSGGRMEVIGSYPGWQYRPDSPLREKMTDVYERMYGTKPAIEAIHAGLECGLLSGKIADLDCVAIGPDMQNIHTTEEYLSISSTARVWEYLVRLLEEL